MIKEIISINRSDLDPDQRARRIDALGNLIELRSVAGSLNAEVHIVPQKIDLRPRTGSLEIIPSISSNGSNNTDTRVTRGSGNRNLKDQNDSSVPSAPAPAPAGKDTSNIPPLDIGSNIQNMLISPIKKTKKCVGSIDYKNINDECTIEALQDICLDHYNSIEGIDCIGNLPFSVSRSSLESLLDSNKNIWIDGEPLTIRYLNELTTDKPYQLQFAD